MDISDMGRGDVRPGGMVDLGAHEEDGPVTWETLCSPRCESRDGEPGTKPRRIRASERTRNPAKKKRSPRGKLTARGTKAEADGDRESEGRIRAMTLGNRVTWSQPSEGGPC
jgi:hypothetical protein